jgi:hypothetical protein
VIREWLVVVNIQITIPTIFCKSQTLPPLGGWSFFNAKITAFLATIFVAFFFSLLVPFLRLSHYFVPPRVVLLFCQVIGGIHFASSPPWSHLYHICRGSLAFLVGNVETMGMFLPIFHQISPSTTPGLLRRLTGILTSVYIRPPLRLSQSPGIIYSRYISFAGLSILPDAFGKSCGDLSGLLHACNMIWIGKSD